MRHVEEQSPVALQLLDRIDILSKIRKLFRSRHAYINVSFKNVRFKDNYFVKRNYIHCIQIATIHSCNRTFTILYVALRDKYVIQKHDLHPTNRNDCLTYP